MRVRDGQTSVTLAFPLFELESLLLFRNKALILCHAKLEKCFSFPCRFFPLLLFDETKCNSSTVLGPQ